MRLALLAAGIAVLGGCSYEQAERPRPSDADVARLEAQLARHPCIGDLGGWERNYRYSTAAGLFTPYSLNPDLDIIEFHLRRAGAVTIDPGRKILTSESGGWPDSADVYAVEGRYKIKGEGLVVDRCQPLRGRSR